MCDVMLIAPFHDDLAYLPREAMAVINALHPRRVLQGEVTESSLYEALDSEAPIDGIWIGSHANDDAIRLSDSEVPHALLSVALAAAGVKWIVLNMCYSDAATAYYTRAGIDVIAFTMGEVEDVDAWRMGRLLAAALDEHGDLEAAYESVRDADPRYQFFPGSLMTRRVAEQHSNRADIQSMQVEMSHVRNEIAEVRATAAANARALAILVNLMVAGMMMNAGFLAWIIITAFGGRL